MDKGLSDSTYGIIVLSNSFFEKGWSEYEFRSLLNLEISGDNKKILPVWHGVTLKDIQKYCPYLADKFALSTDIGINKLAYEVMKVIKPDVINSLALQDAIRKAIPNSKIKYIAMEKLKGASKKVHHTLPLYFELSCLLICQVLKDACDLEYETFVNNFAKDHDFCHEYIIWNAMACAYISFVRDHEIDFSNKTINKDIFSFLLVSTMGETIENWLKKSSTLSKDDCEELLVRYAVNHDFMIEHCPDSAQKAYRKILR
ncbi:MAG: toll/interleukin-1 receptor domain-containing protein [Cloacibacillus porcorum]|nr:toll/interleukin-1 receptor domain-containing protein [Cloacibacillus porcorum]